MQICKDHWEQLRKGVEDRGMSHLVAKSGEEACANMVEELKGGEPPYDPLMAANNMIWSEAMSRLGLSLMMPKEDGSERCPLCEIRDAAKEAAKIENLDQEWITGCLDACLQVAREKGLATQVQ